MSNMITWRKSDGTSVPQKPELVSFEPNPDAHGYVDWYEELPASHSTNKRWRKIIGTWIAEKHLHKDTDGIYYWMDGLPDGYTLYNHHKTSRSIKTRRLDAYLYGSRFGHVFRSPAEFLPHALWLMKGIKECECKYCLGGTQSQIDINARFKLPGKRTHPEKDLAQKRRRIS